MKEFTGWQYLLIDVANNSRHGLDKKTFEERIAWAEANLDCLEADATGHTWKEKPMYLKAVAAVRKAQRGEPTGHLVGFDAVCSGMQIMSVMTGCVAGARATGLVDPDRRADAYTDCTSIMTRRLGYALDNCRKKIKVAVMTALYGSKAEPKKEFGEDTPELNTFWESLYELAPGPVELLEALINSWRPYAQVHAWKLPDGFDARVKVMVRDECRIEVEELSSSFTYTYFENQGKKRDVKNAANVIHSVDAYVLRSLVRRCNYSRGLAGYAIDRIYQELMERDMALAIQERDAADGKGKYYIEQYERSGMADIVILPHLDQCTIMAMSDEHLRELSTILETMLEHEPFEVVTVHDDFKCHPNNMNHLRKHYRDILAEMADSDLLEDLMCQLYDTQVLCQKKSTNLSDYIRQSNYALC